MARVRIQRWEGSTVYDVGRVLSSQVCFEGRTRSLEGHDDQGEASCMLEVMPNMRRMQYALHQNINSLE